MKNNMDYFKTMNEKDLDLTKTAVDWTDKAFRGNGDCAAIARTTGKTCKVVLRDGEDTSFLEGIHAFLWPNLLAINLLNLNEMDHLRSERGSHQITLCISS